MGGTWKQLQNSTFPWGTWLLCSGWALLPLASLCRAAGSGAVALGGVLSCSLLVVGETTSGSLAS